MNEQQAKALARVFGGEEWDSGGGIWLVQYYRGDGKLIVFSGDAVCEYDSDEAFEEGNANTMISLASGDEEWWVIEDSKGIRYFQDEELKVGWRSQEAAEHEARGVASRMGKGYRAVRLEE